MQERLLAARILHFCRQELYWECCQENASERFPLGLKGSSDKILKRRNQIIQENHSGNLYRDTLRTWYEIVQTYTECQLTIPSDRLIAISGVARHMKPLMNDRYIVGLWRSSLCAGIAWMRDSPKAGADKRVLYTPSQATFPEIVPSFSWASIDGTVLMTMSGFQCNQMKIDCVDVRLDSSGRMDMENSPPIIDDIFSLEPNKWVHILVMGQLRSMNLRYDDNSQRWVIPSAQPTRQSSSGTLRQTAEFDFKAFLDFEIDRGAEAIANFERQTFYYMPCIFQTMKSVPWLSFFML